MRESVFQHLAGDSAQAGNIGKLLLDAGKLTTLQAEQTLALQKQRGIRFGEAAVELGYVQPKDIAEILAVQFDYPYLIREKSALDDKLVAAYAPFSPAVEALRSLRTQLMLRWFSFGQKCVMFASYERDAGCSLTVANLAIVFSQLGERTLVIDGNLRTPHQHSLFGLPNDSGLSDILAQRADVGAIQKVTSLVGLHILSAGSSAPNPQELLGRAHLGRLLDELQHEFDVVLIDTAPLQESSDAQLLAPPAQGVVMVLKKDSTPTRSAEKLDAAMKLTKAERLGFILTN